MNRIALTRMVYHGKTYIVSCGLDEKRNLTDFQIYNPQSESILDQIYIARVDSIVPNIRAAFVKISNDQICYLSLEDAKEPIYTQKKSKKPELCAGDEILVQVTREAIKTKEATCTTKISIHGKHCIVTSHNCALGVSKKIEQTQAEQLQTLLKEHCRISEGVYPYGVVLRTNAATQTMEQILEDVTATIVKYQKIRSESLHKQAFTTVYHNLSGYVKDIKSVDLSVVDKIYTDQEDLYEELLETLKDTAVCEYAEFYNDTAVSLATLYHLKGQIDKLMQPRVWLESGANIIIEQLETMTVIDVNTGKNQSKKPDFILNVNIEAAKEIARQLRLRNISGMIIIDFINMKSKQARQKLVDILKQELRQDKVTCSFIDITKLGLVEVTRKKIRKSIREILMD